MDYIRAFLTGGVICALVQILMEKTKMMPGRIMVLLVVSGAVLGAAGIYEPFKEWAGAGAGVPLLGFGNTLWQGVKKAIGDEGILGAFKGGLSASSGGITAAESLKLHITDEIFSHPREERTRQFLERVLPKWSYTI